MKKLFLATASLVVLTGSAMAADMAVKARPIVAAVPACAQFGGLYLGGNVGWKYYNHDWKDKDNFGYQFAGIDSNGDGTESDNGLTVGAQIGYNLQWNCTVWGVQADWNWTDVSASNTYTDLPLPAFGQFTYSTEEKWYATLRTRAGVVVDNLLLYVTGGVAWAKFDRNLAYYYPFAAVPLENFSSSATRMGFVVGVGTEWAWTQNWSINSEILYMGFEKDNQTYTSFDFLLPFRYEYKDSEWVAKVGINYRFGGYAPVVAKY